MGTLYCQKDCQKELFNWCIKWLGMPPDSKIYSIKVEWDIDGPVKIAVGLFPKSSENVQAP